MLIEVMGPDGASKAIVLKEKLCKILNNKAEITRPVIRGELQFVGLDDSTTVSDVVDTIVSYGGWVGADVRVGVIRFLNNVYAYTLPRWYCPLGAAMKTANHGKVRIGWTLARVNLLGPRPVQCLKCWRFGHLRHACKSGEDFSKLCFRCGGSEHTARSCTAPPACKICMIEGRDANHRIGSDLSGCAKLDQNKIESCSCSSRSLHL